MLFRFHNICLDKCKSNYECGEGQKCYYRRCLDSDFCLSDKACSAGYMCSNYKCVENLIPVPGSCSKDDHHCSGSRISYRNLSNFLHNYNIFISEEHSVLVVGGGDATVSVKYGERHLKTAEIIPNKCKIPSLPKGINIQPSLILTNDDKILLCGGKNNEKECLQLKGSDGSNNVRSSMFDRLKPK